MQPRLSRDRGVEVSGSLVTAVGAGGRPWGEGKVSPALRRTQACGEVQFGWGFRAGTEAVTEQKVGEERIKGLKGLARSAQIIPAWETEFVPLGDLTVIANLRLY